MNRRVVRIALPLVDFFIDDGYEARNLDGERTDDPDVGAHPFDAGKVFGIRMLLADIPQEPAELAVRHQPRLLAGSFLLPVDRITELASLLEVGAFHIIGPLTVAPIVLLLHFDRT